ncbi:Fur family transcriptional regulator [Mesorhizobium sp. ES1-3]|uniref:Fur family transcriptional regulator n=1 Tax=Mesorhizobium sp. ES1-3 TaxID=2876628 RepID=UPI001CCAAD4C|nr:Fur family transcriptional regulator [Mesorhizobium sp. ES1-3]MBZ9668520.1 transcriptional repressor [Mesorhizobium sp. ES1-3]
MLRRSYGQTATVGQIPELTRNQKLVLEVISRARKLVSAYDILDEIRPQGIRSPVQVYRAVKKLIQDGTVHKIESLNAFVLCAGPHAHGQGAAILAICERCGRVAEFCDDIIDRRLAEGAGRQSFKIEAVSLELSGLCADCLVEANATL